MSDIIVKFKPQGDKELVAAINAIQASQKGLSGVYKKTGNTVAKLTAKVHAQGSSWKKLGVSQKTLTNAIKGSNVAMEKLRIAMKKTTKSGRGMLRNNRLISNSFATMRSHLLLYQFALAMGVRQTVDLAKQAGKVNSMKNAFVNLSGGTENAAMSMVKLQRATNGTMSQMDLLQQANNAMVLGVTKNSDEMSEMFDMAQRLGRALGVDTARSIESLVTGLGRQSVKMLDNIGIIVKSNEAYEDYADANGLVASQLTDAEKRQAFFNAALTSGRKKMKQLGPEIFTVQDSFDRFTATIEDLGIALGNLIGPQLQSMMDSFSDMIFDFTAGPTEKLIRDLEDAGVETQSFTFLIEELNKELREKAKVEATAASGVFIGNMVETQGSLQKTTEFLQDYGLGIKKVETTQDLLTKATSNYFPFLKLNMQLLMGNTGALGTMKDILKSGILTVVDFDKASKETILTMEERIGVIQKEITASQEWVEETKKKQKEGKKLTAVEKTMLSESKRTQERLLKEGESIMALLPTLKAYVGQQELVKKSTEENTETFATELKAIDKKSLLQEQLLKVQQDLETVMNKANVDAAEKKLSDEEALKLKEKEINIKNQLIKLDEDEAASALKTSLTKKKVVSQAFSALSDLVGMNEKYAKAAAGIQAAGAVVDAFAAAQSTFAQTSKIAPPPFPQIAYAAALATGLVNARKVAMSANDVGSGGGGPKYEQGGYVGGRRHSQGGTIIEAERGEFVMSRNAVQSIGLETLNQMNKGGGAGNINISVTGNVLTQDFVEGELAESIKEAVRRGSDFGLS